MAPPAPFLYARSSGDGTSQDAALRAALEGDLQRLRAGRGHLEVCKYLVEELGGDVNAPAPGVGDFAGVTPFMTSAQSGDVLTVKYLLDCGGDVTKADSKGRTVLHHAACKGVPVDIDCGRGTPLHQAATNEKDKTVKILLEHHADPNTTVTGLGTALMGALLYRSLKCMKLLIKASILLSTFVHYYVLILHGDGTVKRFIPQSFSQGGADVNRRNSLLVTPLVFATGHKGYTNFVQFLLKAGADPNIPDAYGRLPVEHAARHDCREEVEMLFPLTSPIPTIPNWSIDGIISHAKSESAKPLVQSHLERTKAIMKSQADHAFRLKDYKLASKAYGVAIGAAPSATLYANRSLCKLLLGDGEGALSDALRCRMLRPNWAKACYRQAAAHMLLKEGQGINESSW
ncbi:ankyrin repeat and SOCS box protein 2 isoform X5 [Triticum aestivum]|uniref:ankyrin repeat and SOCS box protein 2 isoform X5 n=1 Tax=Triticum aestivum TaxID=4565 RepID=UPI001D033A92|nr:ankyrin repeat and SOCS box protein 2-like isoform X5 [Triticum aestivum]